MQEKPKISHFADEKEIEKSVHDKDAADTKRANLVELYPSPRTYDQNESSESLRKRIYERRLAKYPSFYIAGYGSVVVGMILVYFKNLGEMWFSSSDRGITMSIVFFSFLIGMIIFALAYTWVRYVINAFYPLGRSTGMFWIANGILLAVLIAIDQNQTIFSSSLVSTTVFIVSYFVFTLGMSSVIIRNIRK